MPRPKYARLHNYAAYLRQSRGPLLTLAGLGRLYKLLLWLDV